MPERREIPQLEETTDLAWLIGTLSGTGNANPKTGQISLRNESEPVQREFIRLGERVFGVDIPYRSLWTTEGKTHAQYITPCFYSTRIARALGDLSRKQFPQTVEEKHAWILQELAYTIRYTEGLFEARGNIYKRFKSESKDIIFQTSFPHVSDFIADVLTKIGVTPTIIRMNLRSELRTKGVTISTLPEQKKFAQLIHSLDSEKEEQLELFRNASLEGIQIRVKSREELIDEWRKMTDLLGHPPNANEIDTLWKEQKTKWTHETYIYWLGETEKGKRFSAARRKLISITDPELIQEELEVLARRRHRRIEMSQKRAERLELDEQRRQRRAELVQALRPSRELAWILGLLSSGGNVDLKSGSMVITSPDQSLQNAYINIAGNLFRTNLTWQTFSSKPGERLMPQFNNATIARGLGDLRRSNWPSTIIERHRWLIEDQRYTWAFLSGIFDDKGIFGRPNQIAIPTSIVRVANFIAELMTYVGVQRPSIVKSSSNKEGVQAVAISNISDLRVFARNVRSTIPEKEKALEAIRTDTIRKPRNLAPIDENELVAEWRRLYKLLDHLPNVTDIAEMYTEGRTRWSAGVYARVFGRTGVNGGRSYKLALEKLVTICGLEGIGRIGYRRPDSKYTIVKDISELINQYRLLRTRTLQEKGHLPTSGDFDKARKVSLITYSRVTFANYFGDGSLSSARDKLERLSFEIDVDLSLKELQRLGIDIRYTPKSHRPFEEEAKKRLEEIILQFQQQALPRAVLVAPDGSALIPG